MPLLATASFSAIDWFVIGAYLLVTTLIGARLAGEQATIRDFFLGGRRLPWWAICGSIIATEISAATIVSIPVLSFVAGGSLTFLQLALGAIIAKCIVGLVFVPRFYEREIYSPYDYLEQRLGPRTKQTTTGLFFVGAILGQGARVYITAFVLSVVAGIDLIPAIWAIGLFSVAWTLLGGITTVIWTDVIQFCVLAGGAVVALICAVSAVPSDWSTMLRTAAEAGKFELIDARLDPTLNYTLWCGLLATPFLNLAAFGTDQVMAQRMFCCRDQRDACRAIITSSLSIVIAVLMLFVGISMFVYFLHQPFTAAEAADYQKDSTFLLPIFIVRALPVGIRGLIVAAIFASAVSTLDSTLAALSQTTLSAFLRNRPRGKRSGLLTRWLRTDIAMSKALVVVWGVVLSAMASACILIARQYDNALDLALGLTAYTYGPLLAIFILAFLPWRMTDAGLPWAVPLSMLAVFAGWVQVDPHAVDWADVVVWTGAAAALLLALVYLRGDVRHVGIVALAAVAILLLHRLHFGVTADGMAQTLAYPWSYPVGALFCFVLAAGLSGHRAGGALQRASAPAPRKKPRRRQAVRR